MKPHKIMRYSEAFKRQVVGQIQSNANTNMPTEQRELARIYLYNLKRPHDSLAKRKSAEVHALAA